MAYQRISPAADHLAYPALPWLAALLGAGLAAVAPLPRWSLVCPVLVWTWASRTAAAHYAGEDAYWHAELAGNPRSWLAQNHLGALLLRERRIDEAARRFRAAVALNPSYVEAQTNLGLALEASGNFDQAQAAFETGLKLRPGDPVTEQDLAALHLHRGDDALRADRPGEAEREFREAAALAPANPAARNNLGIALGRQGRFRDAIACYRAALQLRPDYETARYNLRMAELQVDLPPAPQR